VTRLGKRIVIGLDGELFLVLHLMVAGRLHWKARGASEKGKITLAAFDFDRGTLVLSEASSKKRAAIFLLEGRGALEEMDGGGIEVFETDLPTFRRVLSAENRTLKRSLTDPRLLSGIGNSYSDEILHRARLSPFRQTGQLSDGEWETLFAACRAVL